MKYMINIFLMCHVRCHTIGGDAISDLDTSNGTNLSGRVICSAKLLTSQAWIMVQGNFGSKHIKCLHWMNGTKQLLKDVPLLYLPPHRLINGSGTLSAAIS